MADDFFLQIARPGKAERSFRVEPGVYPIGSDAENLVVLPDSAVNWRHAVLSVGDDGLYIEDLMTDHGTLLDEARVTGRRRFFPGQTVRIGPYSMKIVTADQAARAVQGAPPAPPPAGGPPAPPPEPATPQEDPTAQRARQEEEQRRRSIRRQIQNELLQRLDIKRLAAGRIDEKDLRRRAQEHIREIIRDVRDRLPADIDSEQLGKEVYDEAIGLGPLEDLLADPEVTEIMVNGCEKVYIERRGKIYMTGKTFLDDDSVLAVIERIVSPIGRRIDESQPYVDARLADGSRVNAIIHPLSLIGPCLTIRKFAKDPFTKDDLIRFGTWTPGIVDFIRACVLLRKNMIISGGTGSGKTTLLNVISSFIPPGERIITIEDAAELRMSQPHVIRLEARPPNIEGKGAVTIRDLVRNALRMRPDRIVVGEVRGGEALDMLQAMNTGHEGSLTTVHANSPRDVISRLETMVLMSGMELPLRAIREQVGAAIHLIVHEARFSDGTRKVSRITEVVGLESDQITMQDIFTFEQRGLDVRGRVLGRMVPTGSVPTFVEEMKTRGIQIDHTIFDPARAA
ncbi:MAG: FHA domain-containing protein [Lentisphaerae bacterium]|nr:FHA domain-containing protein [Lentisphaerota bacterium]